MSNTGQKRETRRRTLSMALRGVRQRLSLRAQDVAEAMGMELRSYERFEAGEGRLDLDRIFQFAEVTNSDPLALVCSLYLEDPTLAVRCADNKLVLIQAIALERFNAELADDVRRIEAANLIVAFEKMFSELARSERKRAAEARRWIQERGAPGSGPKKGSSGQT